MSKPADPTRASETLRSKFMFDIEKTEKEARESRYKYSSKLLYEITVFVVRVKVRKTKSLKLSSAAARP